MPSYNVLFEVDGGHKPIFYQEVNSRKLALMCCTLLVKRKVKSIIFTTRLGQTRAKINITDGTYELY